MSWRVSFSQILFSPGVPMANANDNNPDVELIGPAQRGRGVHGQYVYWICTQHPKPETVQRTGVKTLADFDGPTFREMFVKSHQECGIKIEETTCFKEPNENGLFHLNLLVRGLDNICESVNLVLHVPTAVQLVQQAPDTSFDEANHRMRAEAIISMQNWK